MQRGVAVKDKAGSVLESRQELDLGVLGGLCYRAWRSRCFPIYWSHLLSRHSTT
jgi:hypothetical protein